MSIQQPGGDGEHGIEVNRQDANEVAREEREKTLVSLLDDVCLY